MKRTKRDGKKKQDDKKQNMKTQRASKKRKHDLLWSQNCCRDYEDGGAEADVLIKPTGVGNASNHDLINHN